MKKLTLRIVAAVLALSMLTGCSGDEPATTRDQGEAIGEVIVTTPTTEAFTYDKDGDFLMTIEDVVMIPGQGLVAFGMIQRGTVKVGDKLEIIGVGATSLQPTVLKIEYGRDEVEEGYAGDRYGIYLDTVKRVDVEPEQALITPGSLKTTTTFTADITLYQPTDTPVTTPYNTDMIATYKMFYLETTGKVAFENDITQLAFGESARVTITLDTPRALIPGADIDIQFDGYGIGEGKIVELVE